MNLQKIESLLFTLLILLLPTQLGRHFWPQFSVINGIRVDYLSPTLYMTDLLLGLLFIVWILGIMQRKRAVTISSLGFKFFVIGIAYLLLTVLFSVNVSSGIYYLLKFVECSFMAFYTASVVPGQFSLVKLLSLIAVGVVVESMLAIAQYINQASIGGLFYFLGERTFTAGTPGIANADIQGELIMRAYGTFPHPNVFAGYLVITMILVFFFLFARPSRPVKYLAGTMILFGTASLLLTLSRTAIAVWILLLIGVSIRQFIYGVNLKKRQTIFILGLILLAMIGTIAFLQTLLPRFLQTAFTEEAFVQRLQLNEAALTMIINNPILGVGLGNFLNSIAPLQTPLSMGLLLQPVHNIFLLVASETGIIGLLSFAFLLGLSYRRLLHAKEDNFRYRFSLLISLSAILFLGLFDHYWLTLQQGQLLFSLVLGLIFHTSPKSFQLGKAKITRKRAP